MTNEGVSVKLLLMGLVLLMTAGGASAEWTPVGSSEQFTQYVDRATIRRNGNFVKMWNLKDFKTVQKGASYSFLSSKAHEEYDCKEVTSRLLAFTWFDGQMGNEKVVFSNSDSGKWEPIEPGSIGESLWKIACGKK